MPLLRRMLMDMKKLDALRCGGRFERFGGVQRDGVLAAGEY